MMGKEFFGKLLSNRQDKPQPWDRDDPEDALAAVELDEAPSPPEESDARSAAGGDGLSSTLPEIERSESSNVDLLSETSESELHDVQPEERSDSDTRAYAASELDEYHEQPASGDLPDDPPSNDHHSADEAGDDLLGTEKVLTDTREESERASGPAASPDLGQDERPLASSSATMQEVAEVDSAQVRKPLPSDTGDNGPPLDAALAVDENLAAIDRIEKTSSENGANFKSTTPAPRESAASPSTADDHSRPTEAPRQEPATPQDALGDSDDTADRTSTYPPNTTHQSEATHAAKHSPAPDGKSTPAPENVPAHSASDVGTATEAAAGPDAPRASDGDNRNDARATPHRNEATAASHDIERPAAQTTSAGERGRQGETVPASAAASWDDPSIGDLAASSDMQRKPSEKLTRRNSAHRSRDRERKEAEPPRARPQPPAAIQGDAELRGIKDRVVIRLLDKQLVSPTHVKAAMNERTKGSLKATLWRIVAHQKGVDREAIYREAALTYAFVERNMEESEIDLEFVRQVADVFPEKRRNRLIELRVVPVGYEFEQQTQMLRVVFLTHDPSLPAVRELMQELNLERYELQYAPESDVKDLLAKAFPRKNEYLERMSEDPLAYDLGMSYEDEKGELIDEDALEAEINRSSLINLFEAALVESVLKGASDIHIYPNAKRQVEIHFRIDGRLVLWHLEDKVHPESLLAVIKDNTMNVDRFERDMAQDGFIQRKVDDTLIRYRVSILPIATASNNLHAESIVIRVLDDRKVITDLSKLGLLTGALERFDMAIRQPHGMVILTGPTGSGKSTTLVAALHQVVTTEVNVLTVEDPVEYIISGVRQIKLNHKLNLEQALRSILRHDPDIVMVGEMRDRETAELAVKLANTGHLTFSTLHTNDAPSAVSRLYKMGVEPFLIAYAINLVVAQRLLRSLCPTCKVIDNDPDPILLKRLGFTEQDIADHTLYKPSGDPTCKKCKGMGYSGRRAISEALYFSRDIRHMIVEADEKIDEDALRATARSEGMLTLQDSAREVVKMGDTSVDEMMRLTMTEE